MSFDETKVQFTPVELDIAEAADELYEGFRDAFADGFQVEDLIIIPGAIPNVLMLYKYLAAGTKAEYAKKLIALGVCLLRDNDFLDALDEE